MAWTLETNIVGPQGDQGDPGTTTWSGITGKPSTFPPDLTSVTQDSIPDGTTYKQYSATEKTKLSGVATGATANDTDANLKARANHTGTQTADTIIDGTTNKVYSATEKTRLANTSGTNTGDQTSVSGNAGTATKLATARNINGVAFDGTAAITINAVDATAREPAITAGTSAQYYRGDKSMQTLNQDAVPDGTTNKAYTATEKTKLSGVATGATANSADATLLARANHTGTQSADTLTDGTTNKAFLATERTKLSGIATGATANSSDATLEARANHTGTQLAATISDFSTAADARVTAGITGKADKTTTVSAGTGLTGGGDLSANRTLAVAYGTTGTTAAAGNDSRLSDNRTPSTGSVVDASVSASAAIALSKLATGKALGSNNGTAADITVWIGTTAQYAALGSYSSTTVYVCT